MARKVAARKSEAAPGGDAAENPRAVPGGNNPPTQREEMAAKHGKLSATIAGLALRAKELPVRVRTEEHLTAVSAVLVEARSVATEERKAFRSEKEPWLAGSREVDSFFNALRGPLDEILETLQHRLDVHAREKVEEERRRAEVERQRLAAEAKRQADLAAKHAGTGRAEKHEERAAVSSQRAEEAGAAATASAADLARTHLATGVTATARETWSGKIENFAEVQKSLGPLGPYFKPAEIEAAVAKWAKATEGRSTIPGAKAEKTISADIRKR